MLSTMYYSSWINESVNASLRSNGGIFLKLYKKLDSVEYVREKWIFSLNYSTLLSYLSINSPNSGTYPPKHVTLEGKICRKLFLEQKYNDFYCTGKEYQMKDETKRTEIQAHIKNPRSF